MEKRGIPKSEFPLDLWPEVLSRLPVKSLLRFRCVCRSWLALIDDPDFARSHLACFPNNCHENRLLTVHPYNSTTNECILRSSETFELESRLALLTTTSQSLRSYTTAVPTYDGVQGWDVVSSTDGLLMLKSNSFLVGDQVFFMLWNPSIRRFRNVPTLPEFVISEDVEILEWGLGFDPVSNDYKYVRVVQADQFKFVAVYSARSNSWSKIKLQGGDESAQWRRCFNYYVKGVCFRGVLYITNSMEDDAIELVSFDLGSETVDSAVLPDELKIKNPNTYQVLTRADGGNSLAMLRIVSNTGSLWVCQSTEGDDKFSSWTQRYTFSCNMPVFCKRGRFHPCLLYLKKNNEMLIRWSRMVSSYHLETQEEKTLLQYCLGEGPYWAYIESLMLLS